MCNERFEFEFKFTNPLGDFIWDVCKIMFIGFIFIVVVCLLARGCNSINAKIRESQIPRLGDSKKWIEYIKELDNKVEVQSPIKEQDNGILGWGNETAVQYEPKLDIERIKIIERQLEKEARSKLGLARSYLAANLTINARKILTSIVRDYTETKSGYLAEIELEKME